MKRKNCDITDQTSCTVTTNFGEPPTEVWLYTNSPNVQRYNLETWSGGSYVNTDVNTVDVTFTDPQSGTIICTVLD